MDFNIGIDIILAFSQVVLGFLFVKIYFKKLVHSGNHIILVIGIIFNIIGILCVANMLCIIDPTVIKGAICLFTIFGIAITITKKDIILCTIYQHSFLTKEIKINNHIKDHNGTDNIHNNN